MGDYVSMKDENTNMYIREYSIVARKLLETYFKNEVHEIRMADKQQGIDGPSTELGGEEGISAYCLISQDLRNAAHYDLDTSVGISIFNERIPGRATNWFFVLPNTIRIGDCEEKAIIIKLFDGCAICWDGRKVFHCTATKDVGVNNHLYGNYWGGKVYK